MRVDHVPRPGLQAQRADRSGHVGVQRILVDPGQRPNEQRCSQANIAPPRASRRSCSRADRASHADTPVPSRSADERTA